MSQTELVQTAPAPALTPTRADNSNPFARQSHAGLVAGTVTIESERAIAEAQGKLVIAKKFPRDSYGAFEAIMQACRRPGLAKSAFYTYKRGGQTVSGPSIRLAEELARAWGNIEYGLRELSQTPGVSEMEAYAWDVETNTSSRQQFTVRHLRDRSEDKGGAKELTDQRDIYEITANMGARRLRARILAVLPDDIVDAAVNECRRTLANADRELPMPDRIKRTITLFSELSVTKNHIEGYLGHDLDATTADELVTLYGVYRAIKDGHSRVGDYFGTTATAPALKGLDGGAGTQGTETDQKPEAKPKPASRRTAAAPPAAPTAAEPSISEPPAPALAPAATSLDDRLKDF